MNDGVSSLCPSWTTVEGSLSYLAQGQRDLLGKGFQEYFQFPGKTKAKPGLSWAVISQFKMLPPLRRTGIKSGQSQDDPPYSGYGILAHSTVILRTSCKKEKE